MRIELVVVVGDRVRWLEDAQLVLDEVASNRVLRRQEALVSGFSRETIHIFTAEAHCMLLAWRCANITVVAPYLAVCILAKLLHARRVLGSAHHGYHLVACVFEMRAQL